MSGFLNKVPPTVSYVLANFANVAYATGDHLLQLDVVTDLLGDFNDATDTFTAPVAGRYIVTLQFNVNVAPTGGTAIEFYVFKNGSALLNRFPRMVATVVSNLSGNASAVLNLAAGDTITFHENVANSSGTTSFDTSTYSNITITRSR